MNANTSSVPAATTATNTSVAIGPQSWQEILPTLLALLTVGTAQGQSIARRELERMALAADMSSAALGALGEFVRNDGQDSPASVHDDRS